MTARRRATRSATLRESHVELAVRDGRLRIALIADTHGDPQPAAAGVIAALQPDAVLHAGDVGDPACLDAFAAIAPLTVVRGNIDAHDPDWPDRVTVDVVAGGERVVRLLLQHIALVGPRLRAEVARAALACGARIVVCGHSHVPFIGRDHGVAVFNPGSIGPPRFPLPAVFGVIDIADGRLTLRHHDAATGAVWMPG